MIVRGFRELHRQSETAFWEGYGWSDLHSRGREFWGFVGVVYWQTGIDFLPKHLSTLVVGGLLGPAAAGLFQFAREISTVMSTPAVLLREVLFPELTRAWIENRERFQQMPYRAALVTGCAGLLLVAVGVFAGRPLLGLVGNDYIAAHALMVLFLAAGTFDLTSASFRAAVYAMGRATSLLRIHVLGVGVYFATLLLLTWLFGLIGGGIAAIAASVLTLSLTFLLFRS
jgi:O-antigen/teichoic acid export membrane protein